MQPVMRQITSTWEDVGALKKHFNTYMYNKHFTNLVVITSIQCKDVSLVSPNKKDGYSGSASNLKI